ncbi:MAG: hypothetical protein KIS67_16210 [Verrucomicrobiae bacterium]|nr:hypothetical protein [Verrucomicrobiae bacterium]
MILLAQTHLSGTDPEMQVAILVLVVLAAAGVMGLIGWVRRAAVAPEPWDANVAAELAREDAVPICHRCLTPHHAMSYFCPECGAPVGAYTNCMPFLYLFSIGHTLRIGTSGEFRRSPLTVAFFFLLGLAQYTLFVPVYWIVLLRGLTKRNQSRIPSGPVPSLPETK